MEDVIVQDMKSKTGVAAPAAPAKPGALLAAFRQIGAPLLQALAETAADDKKSDVPFSALIDSALALNKQLAVQLDTNSASRWPLMNAASQIAAAHFKATGQVLQPEQTKQFAELVLQLQGKYDGQGSGGAVEKAPETAMAFRIKMMEAMVPVVNAVGQYAFGRAEHALLAEISEKLVKTADQMTRTLTSPGSSPEQWRMLCWNVMRAAGQIYADCHFAEADRLLYMSAEDRAAYFAQHGNVPPMTQVWQAFNQRMAMLATLAMYLEVPANAGLEEEAWNP